MNKNVIEYFLINVAVFAVITLWGIFGMGKGNVMNYTILGFYIIIPLTTMICSFMAYDGNIFNAAMYIILISIIGYIIPGLVFKKWGITLLKFTYTLFPAVCGMVTRHIVIKNSN